MEAFDTMRFVPKPKIIHINGERFKFVSMYQRSHLAEREMKRIKKDGFLARIIPDGINFCLYKGKKSRRY